MPIQILNAFHSLSLIVEGGVRIIDCICQHLLHIDQLSIIKRLASLAMRAEFIASLICLAVVLSDSMPYYAESTIGENLCREGRVKEAEAHLERALSYSKTWSCKDPRRIRALNNMAQLYHRLGKFESATFYAVQTAELSRNAYPGKIASVLSINNLAAIYRDAGEEEKAEYHFSLALKMYDELPCKFPLERWKKIDIVTNFAKLHLKQGKFAQAREELTNCLAAFRAITGEHDVALGGIYEGLGKVCYAEHQLEEARNYYKKVLMIDENHFGQVNETVATDYDNLGETLLCMNRLAAAEHCFWTATKIRVSIYGKSHPSMGLCNYNIAKIRFKQSRFAEALWLARHALTFVQHEDSNGSQKIEELIAKCQRFSDKSTCMSSLASRN